MPSHHEKRILPYTAEQLFDLVMDIESYPEFLPWCSYAAINEKKRNNLTADVVIGYKFYQETFSSRVHFKKPTEVEVEYLKGPMRHLHNKWEFKNLRGGKCEVNFYVDFSLQSRLLEALVDQFFHKALSKMIYSFETRADELYG